MPKVQEKSGDIGKYVRMTQAMVWAISSGTMNIIYSYYIIEYEYSIV